MIMAMMVMMDRCKTFRVGFSFDGGDEPAQHSRDRFH